MSDLQQKIATLRAVKSLRALELTMLGQMPSGSDIDEDRHRSIAGRAAFESATRYGHRPLRTSSTGEYAFLITSQQTMAVPQVQLPQGIRYDFPVLAANGCHLYELNTRGQKVDGVRY